MSHKHLLSLGGHSVTSDIGGDIVRDSVKIMAFYGREAINNFPNTSQKINYFPNFLNGINDGNNGKLPKQFE